MNKKIPMRSCIVTKEKLPKIELIRVVRTTNGEIVVDSKGKINGRGAYIKKNIDVIKKAKENKILDRHLETSINESIYDELEKLVQEQ